MPVRKRYTPQDFIDIDECIQRGCSRQDIKQLLTRKTIKKKRIEGKRVFLIRDVLIYIERVHGMAGLFHQHSKPKEKGRQQNRLIGVNRLPS